MLIQCQISRDLWGSVQDWIIELGMVNYNISDTRIILDDLENVLTCGRKENKKDQKRKKEVHVEE